MRAWLAPAGAAFGALAALRAEAYRRGALPVARLRGPVISVGNLSVGGSGKTPTVALLARWLAEAGAPVAVLSRGYRGSFQGDALIVSDGERVLASAAEAGDEPAMLAHGLPGVVVATGRRRDIVGRAVEARFGPRVHVLDDGFQHLRLGRELDVVCLDPDDLRDRPLPAGRLREFPSALARAHVGLLVGGASDTDTGAVDRVRRLGCDRVLAWRRDVRGFFTPEGEPAPAPRRAFLLAGIARPGRLEDDVRTAGAAVAGRRFFADHHAFTPRELEAAAAEARDHGADALVTTEKDLTRIPAPGTTPPLRVLRIAAAIEDAGWLRERVLAVARQVPA